MIYYPATRLERVVGGNGNNYEGDRGVRSFVQRRTVKDAAILYLRIVLYGNRTVVSSVKKFENKCIVYGTIYSMN